MTATEKIYNSHPYAQMFHAHKAMIDARKAHIDAIRRRDTRDKGTTQKALQGGDHES